MRIFKKLYKLAGFIYGGFQRPVMQGAAEVAGGLFTGSAYVPYGDGQRSEMFKDAKDKAGLEGKEQKVQEKEVEKDQPQKEAPQPKRERGGRK